MKENGFYVRADKVSVGYDGKPLIRDMELFVSRGEILTLIGPNGSGKSTILKSLIGQLELISGTVYLDGQPMKNYTKKETAERMSVLMTERIRPDRMTCEEVVETGRYPYTGRMGILSADDHRAVKDALLMTEAQELKDLLYNEISDGQKQRVLLARAIAQEPEVMVLDEPTSFLDIKYKLELLTVLKKLAKEKNAAVILSLHELDLARKISDRIACVHHHCIERTGTPEEIFTEEYIPQLFEISVQDYRRYFGLPCENLPSGEQHRAVSGKLLRCGYTTGTCAAAAAKAAALYLLKDEAAGYISIRTPAGSTAVLEIEDLHRTESEAGCAVTKDAGDDPDVTNGILICAVVGKIPEGITISGGKGVGCVTKEGLDQAVGEAAINSVPRCMMREALREVMDSAGYTGGLKVCISVPEGEKIAERTFNPRMGITGGISIIGTSGIVEPMSNKALADTIRLEIRQAAKKDRKKILLTPGNFGLRFAKEELGLDTGSCVVCSNFIGDALDAALENEFQNILLIGHIGKLIKLGIGMTNTHSGNGDGRMETMAACALLAGAEQETLRRILSCVTTDAALSILQKEGRLKSTMQILGGRIDACLKRRVPDTLPVGFVCFTNAEEFGGVLMQSENAEELMKRWRIKL